MEQLSKQDGNLNQHPVQLPLQLFRQPKKASNKQTKHLIILSLANFLHQPTHTPHDSQLSQRNTQTRHTQQHHIKHVDQNYICGSS
jgi:hypothetical protein